jgi:hypothetical protein
MDAEQIAWEISEQVGSDVTDKFYRLVEKNGQPLWFDETMLGSRQPLP